MTTKTLFKIKVTQKTISVERRPETKKFHVSLVSERHFSEILIADDLNEALVYLSMRKKLRERPIGEELHYFEERPLIGYRTDESYELLDETVTLNDINQTTTLIYAKKEIEKFILFLK